MIHQHCHQIPFGPEVISSEEIPLFHFMISDVHTPRFMIELTFGPNGFD